MARRPDDTRGALIFQEGKLISGDYYIIAVYDDPAWCTISFSAYELENDATYTYPLTYSEFDALFRFDSELMNPSNQDGRFHWVIERLDFVRDARGQKVLCLAQEPTPDEDEEVLVDEEKPKAQTVAPAYSGGKIDAATRAKLLRELDTQDDAKLREVLVKSEGARKRFLADLHAKRHLEQLKASQRLAKADEEREARLQHLEQIKKAQAEKAQLFMAAEEAKKSTKAQLEALLKQKEAQAVRRLVQEKDEQDRGVGREKDAARQRRKMQERSAAEVASIAAQRAQQIAKKRDESVIKRDQILVRKNRQIAEEVRIYKEGVRDHQARLRSLKDNIIAEHWRAKFLQKQEREELQEAFQELEEVRERFHREHEARRALAERAHIVELQDAAAKEKEATLRRREKLHKEFLLQWRVDASKRGVLARERVKMDARRAQRIREKQDARQRRLRETQFLDTLRSTRSMSPQKGTGREEDGDQSPERASSLPPDSPTAATTMKPAESDAFQRTFEQQQRQRRHAEREDRRRKEDIKFARLQQLGSRDPNAVEVQRIRQWHAQEDERKQHLEDARLARELAQEKLAKEVAERLLQRDDKWQTLEEKRRERSLERERRRNEAVIQRTKNVSLGTALPSTLVY